ncbi:hypothetical protein ACI2KR_08285 [Pseudomonas luteola]
MRKLYWSLSLLWSSMAMAQSPPEESIIEQARQQMYAKNDISSIELNEMYGRDKMIILPISGLIWSSVLKEMPQQFISSLTSEFNTRNTADDLIRAIDARYKNKSYQEAKSLVTRTSNGYTFCLVDDGLRESFENVKGVMQPFFAGMMPLYFQRDDLFEFVRHHEASHCLDDSYDGSSREQHFINTMIAETTADLNAVLVYAHRHGTFDLYFKLIRPMRIVSIFDIEHTTEDAVGDLIKGLDPRAIRNMSFPEVMALRNTLVQRLETSDMAKRMLINAYEKHRIALYLKTKFKESGQAVDGPIEVLLSSNQALMDALVSSSMVAEADIDGRFNNMVRAVIENNSYYADYIDWNNEANVHFRRNLEYFGVALDKATQKAIDELYSR